MGDQTTVLTAPDVRHLLRRVNFGPTALKVKQLTGKTRGYAADQMLKFRQLGTGLAGRDIRGIHNSWFRMMVATGYPLQEKLVLFWHDHFATSATKVFDYKQMSKQHGLLRLYCRGNFKSFVKAINRDAAIMEFLDTVRNGKQVPNENYGRELQELFTLGVKDSANNPNYTQEDIVQIARAFTGWRYDRYNRPVFDDYRHDYISQFPARGPKEIYKSTGGFGPGGMAYATPGVSPVGTEGQNEIDSVIDVIFQHQDHDGKNTVARYIARKLLSYLANSFYATPSLESTVVVDEVIASSSFDTVFELTPLIRAILVHDAFYETETPATGFTVDTRKSVTWPAEYMVSAMRLLKIRPYPLYYIPGGSYGDIREQMTAMGQRLLEPPSVFGWDWETSWLSSATLLARYTFARDIVATRGHGPFGINSSKVIDQSLTQPDAILTAVTDLLGVTDQLTQVDRDALTTYLTDNGAHPTLDLHDATTRDKKLTGLIALVLQSPAFILR